MSRFIVMRNPLLYIIFFTCLFSSYGARSQGLTGTWEGLMGDEYLQVNIVQENDTICGYTYDYVLGNPNNHCKAWFSSHYNKKQHAWVISGISFIENSGSHIFMHIKLWHEKGDDKDILQALEIPRSALDFVLTLGSVQFIELKRISRYPTPLDGNRPVCYRKENSIKDSPLIKTSPLMSTDTVKTGPSIVKPPTLAITTDTVQQMLQKMKDRKNITISRLPVEVKNITLNVYDNAIVDGDTVSIFYNGRLLVSKQRLSEKPIVLNIELDEKAVLHEIILFAENLGSIPPNTALVVVTAGDKRYELHASSSLEENAVLVFEYKRK